MRNDSDDFIFALTHKLESRTILETELWVTYNGICLDWGKDFRKLVLEFDLAEANCPSEWRFP